MYVVFSRIAVLSALLATCTACGANIEMQRNDPALSGMFSNSKFYLEFDDGSKSNPDNIDGYVNLLWTNDSTREKLVDEYLKFLQSELQANGFNFVSTAEDSSVHAHLRIKSVRFDPVLGWITDDAQVVYTRTDGGAELGTVVADEIWFTPTIKMVFEALVEGSLRLWGLRPDE